MAEQLNSLFAMTLFVKDHHKSKAFYEQVFETAALFEDESCVVFKFAGMFVNLTCISSAQERVEPHTAGIPRATATSVLAIRVNNVDAVCAGLIRKGVTLLNGPIDRPWGMRSAAFADPDGHVWSFSQDLD